MTQASDIMGTAGTTPYYLAAFEQLLKQLGYGGPTRHEVEAGGNLESGLPAMGYAVHPDAMGFLSDRGVTALRADDKKTRGLQFSDGSGADLGRFAFQDKGGLNPLQAALVVWGLGLGAGSLGAGLGGAAASAGGGSLLDAAAVDAMVGAGSLAPEGIGALIPGGATLGGGGALTGGALTTGAAGSLLGGGIGTLPADPFGGAAVPAIAPETLSTAGLEPLSLTPIGTGSGLTGGGLLSGLGSLKSLAPVAGAIAGSQKSGGGTTTAQSKTDPRIDPYLYGDQGILRSAADWFAANRSGVNPAMQQGWDMQLGLLRDPALMSQLGQLRSGGLGMVNAPVAGNGYGLLYGG